MKLMVALTIRRDPAVAALIPAEQAHIRELMQQGKVDALYVGASSHVWLVMEAASSDAARQAVEAFPLHPYMEQIAVEPLSAAL